MEYVVILLSVALLLILLFGILGQNRAKKYSTNQWLDERFIKEHYLREKFDRIITHASYVGLTFLTDELQREYADRLISSKQMIRLYATAFFIWYYIKTLELSGDVSNSQGLRRRVKRRTPEIASLMEEFDQAYQEDIANALKVLMEQRGSSDCVIAAMSTGGLWLLQNILTTLSPFPSSLLDRICMRLHTTPFIDA